MDLAEEVQKQRGVVHAVKGSVPCNDLPVLVERNRDRQYLPDISMRSLAETLFQGQEMARDLKSRDFAQLVHRFSQVQTENSIDVV